MCSLLKPNRKQLAAFLKDDNDALRKFEKMFDIVEDLAPNVVEEAIIAAGSADAKAQEGLDRIENFLRVVEYLLHAPVEQGARIDLVLGAIDAVALSPAEQNSRQALDELYAQQNSVPPVIFPDLEPQFIQVHAVPSLDDPTPPLPMLVAENLGNGVTGRGKVVLDNGPTFVAPFTITAGTTTTSNPIINATQTWGDAAVTFTGWKVNITDIASAAASLFVDLQVGGSSKFKVTKAGAVTATGAITARSGSGDAVSIGPYGNGGGGIEFGTGANTAYLYQDSGSWGALIATGNLTIQGTIFDIASASGVVKINGTQVLKSRITGYGAMTGTANRATVYDTSTITLEQLAQRVKAMQDDSTTHGFIGA